MGKAQRKIKPEEFAKAIGAEPMNPFEVSRWTREYERAKGMEQIEVSREEFIRLYMDEGNSLEKAEVQTEISEALGSAVMIGDKLVKIKK